MTFRNVWSVSSPSSTALYHPTHLSTRSSVLLAKVTSARREVSLKRLSIWWKILYPSPDGYGSSQRLVDWNLCIDLPTLDKAMVFPEYTLLSYLCTCFILKSYQIFCWWLLLYLFYHPHTTFLGFDISDELMKPWYSQWYNIKDVNKIQQF